MAVIHTYLKLSRWYHSLYRRNLACSAGKDLTPSDLSDYFTNMNSNRKSAPFGHFDINYFSWSRLFFFPLPSLQAAALEMAMIKMVVPSMANQVIDRAIQVSSPGLASRCACYLLFQTELVPSPSSSPAPTPALPEQYVPCSVHSTCK